MKIIITGATGLIGSALTRHFTARGDEVTAIGRSAGDGRRGAPAPAARGRVRRVAWDPARGTLEGAALEGHDVAINLAGESIAGVWTPAKKRRIRESRIRSTALLAQTLARLERRPRTLFSASGIGFYGHRGDEPVDESAPPGTGFMAALAQEWEAAAAPASAAGIRVVNTRFGNVLAPHGGLLATLLPLFRLGLGARFGSGRARWPWVALAELPHVFDHLIAREQIRGPVNVVAPESPTNTELVDAIAHALGRPRLFALPSFAARLMPGGMGEELLLSGARVVPGVLTATGYPFRHPTLRPALAGML